MLGVQSARLEGINQRRPPIPSGTENSMGQGPGVGVRVNTPELSPPAGMAPGLSRIKSAHPCECTDVSATIPILQASKLGHRVVK